MLSRYKNLIFLVIVLALTVVYSCTKDKGDYSFNKSAEVYSGNVYDYLKSQTGMYDSMLLVIDRIPGLADSLKNDSTRQYTVFAATNISFQIALNNLNQVRYLKEEDSLSLATIDVLQLDTMMCRYLIKGVYKSDTLFHFMDGLLIPSLKKDTVGKDYRMHVQGQRLNATGLKNGGPVYITFSDTKSGTITEIFQRFWVSTPTIAVDRVVNNGIVHTLSTGHDFGFGEFIKRADK